MMVNSSKQFPLNQLRCARYSLRFPIQKCLIVDVISSSVAATSPSFQEHAEETIEVVLAGKLQ
jgi:hypothetical protein